MSVYGVCAANIVSSACCEDSPDSYSVPVRPPSFLRAAPGAATGEAAVPRAATVRAGRVDLPRTETAARRADVLARSLCAARDRLAAPLALLAASIVGERAWFAFGYARGADFAREHFGRSCRWLRDLAALHHALTALDGLAAALAGDDDGAPLGRRRALLIGRIATPATLPAWIAQARRLTVRELQAEVARARLAGDPAPSPHDAGPPLEAPGAPSDDSEDRTLVRMAAPGAVVAAFDEAVDLYRAVEGGEETVTSFVEALVAEASAGGFPPDVERTRAAHGPAPAVVEAALARSTDHWRHLPQSLDVSWELTLGRETLARLRAIARERDTGTAAARVARMKDLLAIENEIEIHLGRLLASMGDHDAWNRLRFTGMAHYAEERLGLGRTAALTRARAARLTGRFPLLREAYEGNAVGLEAALVVGRILSVEPRAPAERAWVSHATEVTIKRLRDEMRALDRSCAFGLGEETGADPLRDADWHASLRRAPGTARRRVAALGLIALGVRPDAPGAPASESPAFSPATDLIPEPDVFLRLTLPDDLAGRFLAAIDSARRLLSDRVEAIPWHEDWPGPQDTATPALLAARMFSIRCRHIPAWVGLLALIEDFVATWDPDRRAVAAADAPILERDGWRCAAPACSSRRRLQVHHLVYRSHCGGNEEWNRLALCLFHHHRGEHGGLARVAGRAPIGLTWRLGAASNGSWYRNERRIAPPEDGDRGHLRSAPW